MAKLPEHEIKELVESCKREDRVAQNKLFKSYYGLMLSVCMRYIPDIDEAKDIVQDGFVKVFQNIHGFENAGSFEGWLKRIIVNTAIDSIRKSKQTFVSIDAVDYDWLEADDDSEIDWNELIFREKERVMAAIDRLPPSYKAIFCLFVIEDYSHKESAEILGISEGTCKSNLAKARIKLIKELKALQY